MDLNELNIARETSSFPQSLTVLRVGQLRPLSNKAVGGFANDLGRQAVLEHHGMKTFSILTWFALQSTALL